MKIELIISLDQKNVIINNINYFFHSIPIDVTIDYMNNRCSKCSLKSDGNCYKEIPCTNRWDKKMGYFIRRWRKNEN